MPVLPLLSITASALALPPAATTARAAPNPAQPAKAAHQPKEAGSPNLRHPKAARRERSLTKR